MRVRQHRKRWKTFAAYTSGDTHIQEYRNTASQEVYEPTSGGWEAMKEVYEPISGGCKHEEFEKKNTYTRWRWSSKASQEVYEPIRVDGTEAQKEVFGPTSGGWKHGSFDEKVMLYTTLRVRPE